ncbi:MAG TPA: amino acid permease [Steroidobacteraceae bacterium]|jgi:L-asparagine transporter-like permease|nr:amino acid permease [Steroidobacteraceae bacterium]
MPSADADKLSDRERGLRRSLGKAQIVMIGLGGAIGTGLFMGSGLAVGYAGPAVIVSYALAGFVALVMVFSLSEMAVVHPTAGSFGTYAEMYLNPWAGFVVRYTYWIAEAIAVGGEAVAAGLYMQYWFPNVPVWMWALGFCLVLLYFNSRSVANFGTLESWLALIKVVAIVLFIILGLAAVIGLGRPATGLHNLTGLPGGFLPKGVSGLWMAVTVGIFSFNGIEVIAVTSGETKNPEVAIPAALRTMVLRLFLFYLLSITVIVAVIPWTATGVKVVAQSPFVTVFQHSGIRDAAGIMNFVVISAALSSMNTDVYLCSRMLFSLSRGGYAPRRLGTLSKRGSPVAAILVSGVFVLIAAAVSGYTPDAYADLLGVALFAAILVWMFILASHLSFRRRQGKAALPVRMPFFPWMQYAGLAMLAGILVTMGLDPTLRVSWLYGVPWLALISVIYFVRRSQLRASAAASIDCQSGDEAQSRERGG